MSEARKPVNEEEMTALAKKLCEEHGADGVEIVFMIPDDENEEVEEQRFYYGVDAEEHGEVIEDDAA